MFAWLRVNGTPGVVLAGVAVYTVSKVVGEVIIGAGVVLFLIGSFPRTRRLIPWLIPERDSEFWEKVFDALPSPAFIKPYPEDRHLRDNLACRTFQGRKPSTPIVAAALGEMSTLHDRIRSDHQTGDKRAAQQGVSAQLELTDPGETKNPRAILTSKACIEHNRKRYIVGCYVPVTPPHSLPLGETMNVAECGGQVLFKYPATAGRHITHPVVVRIGQSVQTPRVAESKTP